MNEGGRRERDYGRSPGAPALLVAALLLAGGSGGATFAHVAPAEHIEELDRRIARQPRDPRLYLARGDLHRDRGAWDAATADYARARALDPALDIVDFLTGRLRLEQGRLDLALEPLNRFLERHPGHAGAHLARARSLARLGRPAEAGRDYESAIALARANGGLPDPDLYLERARARQAVGDVRAGGEALAGLEEGIRILGSPASLILAAAEFRQARPGKDHAPETREARRSSPRNGDGGGAVRVASSATTPAASPAASGQSVVVQIDTAMSYRANGGDPGIGLAWTLEEFDDASWALGTYGVGYETVPPGAINLLRTTVPAGTASVYTRARFTVADLGQVVGLAFGADYDDGYVAWVNGIEVARSPTMPPGSPVWNTSPGLHESSNGAAPDYGTLVDITAAALPVLHTGENVLAVGVWNNTPAASSDLVLVPTLVLNPAVPVTRGPYLQTATPAGITVRWRTGSATDSRVLYGVDAASLDQTASDATATIEHAVTLSDLAPATRYYYAVGTTAEILAGGDADHHFTTSPEPGSAAPARLWVLGDSGMADANARAVRDAYYAAQGGAHTDLMLMLGDNAYQQGTDAQYQAAVFDMYPEILRQTVLWPTLGNHDGLTADSATQTGPYYDIFTLPRQGEAGGVASGTEAYYAFDHGNVHFICLESYETDRSPSGAMLTWLEQDLAANDKDWTIAFWHHPPYSHGSHNSDVEIELVEMRSNVVPILEQYGVDLVLTGHSHSYERSYLLDGHYGTSATFTSAMIKDGGDGRVEGSGAYHKPSSGPAPREGAVYVVAGSSGLISGGPLDYPAMFLSLNTLGSLVIDIDDRRLDARFLDSTGAWRDSFTMIKGPVTPPLADFSGDPRSGTAPLTVQFTDRSTSGPTQWAWDFDADGTVDSAEPSPAHLYAAPGLYTVRLTASSVGGADTMEKPAYVCVTSADGTADVDVDGVSDGTDGCPCTPDPGQADTDGDGEGDACDLDDDGDGVNDALDCAPLSPGLSAPPDAVADSLVLTHGPAHARAGIGWTRSRGGFTANVYRGSLAGVGPRTHNAVCHDSEVPSTESFDDGVPPGGTAFYYLVAGKNACGESVAGHDGDGAPYAPAASCAPRGRETDGDGRPDVEDNCALAPNPGQTDFDRDTFGDVCDDSDSDGAVDAADCAPLDPSVQTIPAAIGDVLQIGPDPEALDWSESAPSPTFNLYRGAASSSPPFAYTHVCLQADLSVTGATDPEGPPENWFFYYLVSAGNACGEGPLGTDSAGRPRPNTTPCH